MINKIIWSTPLIIVFCTTCTIFFCFVCFFIFFSPYIAIPFSLCIKFLLWTSIVTIYITSWFCWSWWCCFYFWFLFCLWFWCWCWCWCRGRLRSRLVKLINKIIWSTPLIIVFCTTCTIFFCFVCFFIFFSPYIAIPFSLCIKFLLWTRIVTIYITSWFCWSCWWCCFCLCRF